MSSAPIRGDCSGLARSNQPDQDAFSREQRATLRPYRSRGQRARLWLYRSRDARLLLRADKDRSV